MIAKYFDDQLMYFNSENLLLFFVLWDSKVSTFRFWTVGRAKHAIIMTSL